MFTITMKIIKENRLEFFKAVIIWARKQQLNMRSKKPIFCFI